MAGSNPIRTQPSPVGNSPESLILTAALYTGPGPGEDRLTPIMCHAAWDNDRRIQELESDGVIGEIIFPDGSFNNAPPWTGLISFEKDPAKNIRNLDRPNSVILDGITLKLNNILVEND